MSQRTWMWIIGVIVVILAIYFFMGSNEPERSPTGAPATTTAPPASELSLRAERRQTCER